MHFSLIGGSRADQISRWVLIRQLSPAAASGLFWSRVSYSKHRTSQTQPQGSQRSRRGGGGLVSFGPGGCQQAFSFGPQPPPQPAQFTSKISTLEEKFIPRRSPFNYQQIQFKFHCVGGLSIVLKTARICFSKPMQTGSQEISNQSLSVTSSKCFRTVLNLKCSALSLSV